MRQFYTRTAFLLACNLILSVAHLQAQAPTGPFYVTGPSPVGAGSTHTFYYDNGSYITGIKWIITSGTIGTKWSVGTRYYADITFSGTGSKTITLQDINGSITTKSVTASTCSTVTAPIGVDGSRCGPGTVMLATNAYPNGYMNRWYDPAHPYLMTGLADDETYLTPYLSANMSYQVKRVQNSTGCLSSAITVSATLKTLPTSNAGADQISSATCGLTSVTLAGNTVAGTTGAWTITSGTGGSFANATSASSSFTGVNGSTYNLRWTVTLTANSCPAYDEATVTLNKIPTAAASSLAVFSGKSTAVTLSNPNGVAGTQYNWTASSSNVTGASSGSGLTIAQALTTTSNPGTVTYTITPYSTLCTGTGITYTQNVYRAPTITTPVNRLSPGIPVTLHAPNTYNVWRWKNSSQQLVGTDSTFTTSIAGPYTVTVRKTGIADSVTSSPFTVVSQFQGQNLNYIVTSVPQEEITDEYVLATKPAEKVSQTIQYVEGLGRPMQTVMTQGSPLKKDIVQPVAYDAYGRENTKYLPYVATSNDGRAKNDFVKADAGSAYLTSPQYLFYQGTAAVATDAAPYAKTVFETSPMNRPVQDYGAGSAWQASSANSVRYAYTLNQHGTSTGQEKIIAWVISGADRPARAAAKTGYIVTGGYYASGQLDVKQTTDEQGHIVREYTDNAGRVLLKKVQAKDTTSQDLNIKTIWALTYYIYDDVGNLRFVLPPELSKLMNDPANLAEPSQSQLNTWAFQYTYDAQKKMITKRVPGAGTVYLIYDKRDRLVLTQDANQRNSGKKWSFTKYDSLNRPVITGLYTHTGTDTSRLQMQAYVNTEMAKKLCERFNISTTDGYTNLVFPKTGTTVYTATYYDSYDFKSMSGGLSYQKNDLKKPADLLSQPGKFFTRVQGMVTGTKVNTLGTGTYLYSVTYYDSVYRVVQTISKNHKGGYDRSTSTYDFSGKVIESKRTYRVNTDSLSLKETYTYDHGGRVLTVNHSVKASNVTGVSNVMITKNIYNELGQLIDKQLHSVNGTPFKQSVDYRYNIRGWLTSINNSKLENNSATNDDNTDLFGMELGYNDALGLGSTAQFNGNIAAMKWSNNTIESNVLQRGYAFTYDAMNRLTAANQKQAIVFNTWTGGNYDESIPGYDLNGNIKALQRKDGTGSVIDNLTYGYSSGNRLQYVHDAADAAKGFVNGNTGTDDYAYDKNGNLIVDKNKGITAITYNDLNLPVQVNKGPSNYIVYTYDATGRKLSQQVFGSVTKTTDYLAEMIFENNTLAFLNFSEGRILKDGANWEYQYHLKDHLGNVRITFSAKELTNPKTATLETANATAEQGEFLRFAETRKVQSYLFDHTNGNWPTTINGYAQRLSGSANEKFGLAKSISVMPGDEITAEVYAKYIDTNPSNRTTVLNTLISQIALGTAGAGVVVDGGSLGSSTTNFPFAGEAAENTDGSSEAGPKAYLNWLVFKRDGTFLPEQSYYDRLSSTPKETGQDVAHERLYSPTITITEPGFVYIYLSNEESSPVEVYFDDFKVTHLIKAPVVQSDDYYPFGLNFNSYSRENSVKNKMVKFQGQEHIDDLDLGWDSFKWRNHMPDIGRFFNVDPLSEKYYYNSVYAFSENKVVAHVELEGLESAHFSIRPANSSGINDKFDKNTYGKDINNYRATMGVTVDLAKKQISNTNCDSGVTDGRSASLSENKNGSLSLSGVSDFGSDGMVAFSITITNNITDKGDGSLNVQSSIVTDNKSPFEIIMSGTENGVKDDGFLLNTVQQTLAPIPRGILSAPEYATDQENVDVKVYKSDNPGDLTLGFVKTPNDKNFKTSTENDIEKGKKPTIIRP